MSEVNDDAVHLNACPHCASPMRWNHRTARHECDFGHPLIWITPGDPPGLIHFDTQTDMVNHPPHYADRGDPAYETIKVIEAWGLGFNLGNTVKYISRAGRKGDKLEDLKKAAWYLNREIENLEK